MNKVKVFGAVTAVACLLGGTYWLGQHKAAAASALPACVAGPGEICPSDAFRQEVETLKGLDERQKTLNQDPKIKELISILDQQRGMSERMQNEVQQVLTANPGHQWDGNKVKYVPAPPQHAPTVAAPSPTPAPAKPAAK